MEKLFKLWFLVSLWALSLYQGWGLMRFGIRWDTIPVFFLLLLFILLRRLRRKLRQGKTFGAIFTLSVASVFTATFVLSFAAAAVNFGNINTWMDNSLYLLESVLNPVKFYEGDEGKVTVSDNQKKRIQSHLSDLRLYENDINKVMLVAYREGLALVDDQNIRFLTGSGVSLSLSGFMPDRSFLYYSQMNDQLTTTSRIQVLTRAVIRDGTLYKMWERKVPGMYLNHWGDEFEGKIFYPGRTFSNLPDEISKDIGGKYGNCKGKDEIHDNIHILDADSGRPLKVLDLLPIIASYEGGENEMAKSISDCHDPLHINDIQILKDEKHAKFFPDGKIGDLLVSLRNINTAVLLDGETFAVKWNTSNKVKHQHSPRITDWGTLLIFDNLGSDKPNGRSKVTEIDIASGNVVGYWEATGEDYFESYYRGKITILGKQILVQDQDSRSRDNSLFVLDCPGRHVSMSCTKTPIFTGKPPDFRYDNAVIVPFPL